MSRFHKSLFKGFVIEIFAVLIVIIIATFLVFAGKFGKLSFEERIIKISLREEADTKIFTLLSSTEDGYTMENLIGYSILLNDENLEKPISINLKTEIENRLKRIENEIRSNYYFFIYFDNNKYFEIKSAEAKKGLALSAYYLPLPFNLKSLIAEANLVEWK